MIHHQNADVMVLASAHLRGIPPLDVCHFEQYQGGECFSNPHWLGPWRQHLMTNYGLRQNHRKIIGKTKKSAFCVPYSVITWPRWHYGHCCLIQQEYISIIHCLPNQTFPCLENVLTRQGFMWFNFLLYYNINIYWPEQVEKRSMYLEIFITP